MVPLSKTRLTKGRYAELIFANCLRLVSFRISRHPLGSSPCLSGVAWLCNLGGEGDTPRGYFCHLVSKSWPPTNVANFLKIKGGRRNG